MLLRVDVCVLGSVGEGLQGKPCYGLAHVTRHAVVTRLFLLPRPKGTKLGSRQ